MSQLFPGLDRVDVSLEVLGLERVITINASPGCEEKFLMTGYSHSFLQEGIYSNKQRVAMGTLLPIMNNLLGFKYLRCCRVIKIRLVFLLARKFAMRQMLRRIFCLDSVQV